jgi:hypothetical protein
MPPLPKEKKQVVKKKKVDDETALKKDVEKLTEEEFKKSVKAEKSKKIVKKTPVEIDDSDDEKDQEQVGEPKGVYDDDEIEATQFGEPIEGNPMEHILDVFNKYHVGDRDVAKLLLLSVACQSIINSDGIQVSIVGKSSGGKTHCCKIMSHLMPERYIKYTQLSPKAIFHLDDWEEGTVIFSNDVNLSKDMEDVIKRSIDCFKEGDDSYTVLDSKKKPIILKIPKRLTWWLTSVEGTQNDQVLNRFCTIKIDESVKQHEKILKKQKYNKGLPLKITEDVKLCHDIIQILKNKKFLVTVPRTLTNKIEWSDDITDSRRYPLFKTMITSFAVLNHMQRKMEDDILYANKQDVSNAMKLYNNIRGNILLKDEERDIWDIIYRQNNLSGKISINEITEIYKKSRRISRTTVSKYLKSLMTKIQPGTITFEIKTPPKGGHESYYSTTVSPEDMEKSEWVKWIDEPEKT